MTNAAIGVGIVVCAGLAATASADDWVMHLTVDNQFDAWFGTPTATNFHAGAGNVWQGTYTFSALNRLPTDYVYISTSSDHSVAQGFIGEFTNLTSSRTTVTGDPIWEVFPAGRYLQQINPTWPSVWPANSQPTQAEVDAAIAFATANNLWITPSTAPGGAPNGVSPWGFRTGISPNAHWIWHRAPNGPIDPLHGGFNHEEFLVFRIAGAVPAPGSAALLGLAAGVAARRRR